MYMRMKFSCEAPQLAEGRGHLQAFRHGFDEFDTALLVPGMLRQHVFRRRRFAEIVHERRKTNFCVVGEFGRLLDDHHRVNSAVDLRVPFLRLRNTEQRIDFRENDLERAAVSQHLEEDPRIGSRKSGFRLFPYPFRHQRVGLAIVDDLLHELHGFIGNTEAHRVEAGCKLCDTQDPDRIFDECVGNVSQCF